MRRKKREGFKGLPGWMASYADMVTLLMVFFVLMFAMSQIDQDLFERFIASFNPARATDFMPIDAQGGNILAELGDGVMPENVPPLPPDTPGYEYGDGGETGLEGRGDTVSDMYNTFRTFTAEFAGTEVEIVPDLIEGEFYLRIIFDGENPLFAPGQSALSPAAREILLLLGPRLRESSDEGHGIIVEGHTDNIPHPTGNRRLSAERAAAVTDFLIYNAEIEPTLIFPIGMGEYFPIADNDTREGRDQNRRVEIKIFTAEATGGTVGSWFVIPGTRD